MSEKIKAKRYLENRQLIVLYFQINRNDARLTEDSLLFSEEYPDFIPRKDDMVILNNESYFAQAIAYDSKENKVYIMLMTEKEYREVNLSSKKRHI